MAEPGKELPVLWDTTTSPSAFDPTDWLDYCERVAGRPRPKLPADAVQSVMNAPGEDVHLALLERRHGVQRDDFTMAEHPFVIFKHAGKRVATAISAKGSYAAGGLDELIALGARRIVVLCVGGGLTDRVEVGDLIAVSAAVRDDGTSQHYLRDSTWTEARGGLTQRLVQVARARGHRVHHAPVWTNQAHFRLTVPRLRRFRREGCLAVDNEAAAALAVGRHRGVEVAVLLYVGLDFSSGRAMIPGPELFTREAAAAHLEVALDALTGSTG